MQNPFKDIESTKTISEHISIIREYQQTGSFDREKAIKIYKTFNSNHFDYESAMTAKAKSINRLVNINYTSDEDLIENLKLQAKWAVGEEYLTSLGIKLL